MVGAQGAADERDELVVASSITSPALACRSKKQIGPDPSSSFEIYDGSNLVVHRDYLVLSPSRDGQDDKWGYRSGAHTFGPGEYVSIRDDFQVASVQPAS